MSGTNQPPGRPVIRFRVPREGKLWLLIALVFWGTGVFKAINLITLLACLMLVIWGFNAVSARRRLRHLRLRRWLQGPIFANTPVVLEVEARNAAGKSPIGVRLEDRGPHHALTWFVPWLNGRAPMRWRQEIRLPRRGPYVLEPLQAQSGYPFGLVEGRITSGPPETAIVFPQLGQLHRGRLRRALSQSGPSAGRSHLRPCRHPAAYTEVHGVRDFRDGDSPKWIHWRTSARRGALMVREFEEPPTDNLIVVLEPWVPESNRDRQSALEEALSLAATVCWEWCRQKGDQLVLAVAGSTPRLISGITGLALASQMLECLALENGTAEPNTAAFVELLEATELPRAPVLVVCTRPTGLRDALAARLGRPVTQVDVSASFPCAFYERPSRHAL